MSKVRELLNDCRKTCLEVDNLARARDLYRLRHGPIMSRLSPEPREETPDNMPLHRRLSILDNLDALYEQRLNNCAQKAVVIENMLMSIADPYYRSILREYYVIGSTIKTVCTTLRLKRRSVLAWKENAIRELERKIPES